MLTSVRRNWVKSWSERLGRLDEIDQGVGCSAEGALCDGDRVGEMCQCVEYAQRVERGWIGVKWELMNCDGREPGYGPSVFAGKGGQLDSRSRLTSELEFRRLRYCRDCGGL